MSKITAESMAEELRARFYTMYTTLSRNEDGPVVEFWFVREGYKLVGSVTYVESYNTYGVRATLTGPNIFPTNTSESPTTVEGRVPKITFTNEGVDLVDNVESVVESARKIVSAASNQPESYFAPRLPQRLP